jgi:hypothetical protein
MDDRQNGEPPGNRPGWPNPQPPTAAWPPPPAQFGTPAYYGPPFLSPASGARWAIGFLTAFGVLDIITACAELVQVRSGSSFTEFSLDVGLATAGLDVIQNIIAFPCAVFFLIWVYRVCSNALALGAQEMPISPGWAVGYYFVPILAFFRPYQAMRDVWRASEPGLDLRGNPDSWRHARSTPLIGWWWAYWLAYNLVSLVLIVLLFYPRANNTMRQDGVPTMLDILHAGLALVAIRLVALLTRRQDEAYRRLVTPRSEVPT